MTLEAWVTPYVTGYHQPILAKGDTQYALKQTDRTLEFFIYGGGQWITAQQIELGLAVPRLVQIAGADLGRRVVSAAGPLRVTGRPPVERIKDPTLVRRAKALGLSVIPYTFRSSATNSTRPSPVGQARTFSWRKRSGSYCSTV